MVNIPYNLYTYIGIYKETGYFRETLAQPKPLNVET